MRLKWGNRSSGDELVGAHARDGTGAGGGTTGRAAAGRRSGARSGERRSPTAGVMLRAIVESRAALPEVSAVSPASAALPDVWERSLRRRSGMARSWGCLPCSGCDDCDDTHVHRLMDCACEELFSQIVRIRRRSGPSLARHRRRCSATPVRSSGVPTIL